MNILALEPLRADAITLELAIRTAEPSADLVVCADVQAALHHARTKTRDVAFIDVARDATSLFSTVSDLKLCNAQMNIIVVSDTEEHAADAMELHASGFLLKPVTADDVREELDNLRYPVAEPEKPTLTVRCFGTFDAYVDGRPLPCRSAPAMELLAYLVDRRGSRCSVGEIETALWNGRTYSKSHQSQLRRHLSELQRALDRVGCGDILIRQYGFIGLIESRIDCDYWSYLDDKTGYVLFPGEYMSQFSWAERTLGNLIEINAARHSGALRTLQYQAMAGQHTMADQRVMADQRATADRHAMGDRQVKAEHQVKADRDS